LSKHREFLVSSMHVTCQIT